ncbi:hypothetical protein BD626DRAFT_259803 [Schizophyllum amplum]|uniref:Uncharacterized protein n=1 Tax=Schizophyllum amplum TaxID=97359 RepID=A0A550BUM4_9AGAR|nr:hypothetical protein BD626DRAFT_259803 [Auriculariopsis ampla]
MMRDVGSVLEVGGAWWASVQCKVRDRRQTASLSTTDLAVGEFGRRERVRASCLHPRRLGRQGHCDAMSKDGRDVAGAGAVGSRVGRASTRPQARPSFTRCARRSESRGALCKATMTSPCKATTKGSAERRRRAPAEQGRQALLARPLPLISRLACTV